ncbi:transposase, partial [Bacillus anthracis]
KSVTIAQIATVTYFVSILIEENQPLFLKIDTSVGVDLVLKDFAVLSNGIKFENPKWLRIAFLQRSLSCKKKGASNQTKGMLQVAKLHEKIVN